MITLLDFNHGCAVRQSIDDELRFNLEIELFVDVMMGGLEAARISIIDLVARARDHSSGCRKCFEAEARYRQDIERYYNWSIYESNYLLMERSDLFLSAEPRVKKLPLGRVCSSSHWSELSPNTLVL